MTQPRVIRLEANGPKDTGLTPLELDPKSFRSPLPVQNHHQYFADSAQGIAVGVWDTTTMQEAFGPYPGDEFIVVLEGSFAMLDGKGGSVSAQKGQSVCFRNAIPTSWRQDGYLKKFYLTWLDPDADVPTISSMEGGVIVLDPNPPPPVPTLREQIVFTNDAGNMQVSLRESSAANTPMARSDRHEFVQILEGEVRIVEEGGNAHDFSAGDVFFIPQGTLNAWQILRTLKTYHVMLRLPK